MRYAPVILALLVTAAVPVLPAVGQSQSISSKDPVAVPDSLKNFSGMMIGKMLDRDIEKGSFTVEVQYVARVWENNKAPEPRDAVGKVLRVEGISGKWLDPLLLIRPGETVEFEAQHRGGDSLRFPGEWLRKVPPFDASQHPVPPSGFRGFAGEVTGTILEKRAESRELVLKIDSIDKQYERSKAKQPQSVIDKPIVLAGFWAAMSDPFDPLKAGDKIRAGVLHRVPQSDHFTVVEFAEKVSDQAMRGQSDRPSPSPPAGKSDVIPEGLQGFRGILKGELVRRDMELGELVVRAEAATRIWKQNRAKDPASCRGQELLVKGIAGKWLDVLLTLKPGDQIEVEAFHNGGDHLDFIQEHLKKVE
jgi:hypothetical protein